MADYYIDSSVLVKRHIREIGTNWLQRLVDPVASNNFTTARISIIEVYSAFNRRIREGVLLLVDYATLRADFDALCANEYSLVELTAALSDKARLLLERHPLRAYDAVQLASALATNDTLFAAGLAPLPFLSADERLLAAARVEGLPIDNPNYHP